MKEIRPVRKLDQLLGSKAAIACLRVLCGTRAELTGLETAQLSGMSHPQVLRALDHLVRAGVAVRKKAGRAGLYSLNRSSELVRKGLIPLFRLENDLLESGIERFQRRLEGISVSSIVLFGSVARGSARETSDVDLLVVIQEKDPPQKGQILDSARELSESTGLRFSVVVLTEKECRTARGHRKAFLRNVLKDGQIISGKPLQEIMHG